MKVDLGRLSIYRHLKREAGKGGILDFGSGAGYITSFLGAEGVEINAGALKVAKKNYPEIKFMNKSLKQLVKGKKYRVLTAVNVIEHLEDGQRRDFFTAVPKILKKGGKCLFVYDDMYHPLQLLSGIKHPGMLLTDPTHVHCWSQSAFRKMLEKDFIVEKEIKGNILAMFLPFTNNFATARLYVCKPKI